MITFDGKVTEQKTWTASLERFLSSVTLETKQT